MNEVQVYFIGIVMWWLTAPGPFALIPDLSTNEFAHDATITAKPEAFVGGRCPQGFTTDAEGNCTFALNGAGATGGVTISFVPKSSRPVPASSFCMVPKLQRKTTLSLRAEYTPPLGANNAAWMVVEGGTAVSGMLECGTAVPGDCPRFVRWSVPASETEPVELVLANRADGAAPIHAHVKAGAQLSIHNSPRAQHAEHRAAVARPLTNSLDWCAYFQMVKRPGPPLPCPGAPPIPLPCAPSAIDPSHGDGTHRRARPWLFQTIACSNSQYP